MWPFKQKDRSEGIRVEVAIVGDRSKMDFDLYFLKAKETHRGYAFGAAVHELLRQWKDQRAKAESKSDFDLGFESAVGEATKIIKSPTDV